MEKSSNFPKHSKESPVSRLDPTSTLTVLIGQCYWKRCWRRAHWHSMHSFIMCSQKVEGKKCMRYTRGKLQLGLTLSVLPCVREFVCGWCFKGEPHLKNRIFSGSHIEDVVMFYKQTWNKYVCWLFLVSVVGNIFILFYACVSVFHHGLWIKNNVFNYPV